MTVSASHLNLEIRGTQILRDVTFTAPSGAVTAIVGPNGSGKTSLLRAITGELPATGTVQLNHTNVQSMTPAELALWRAVLPQSIELSFPFTVYEVVRLGLSTGLPDTSMHDPERLITQALARVGLADYGPRPYQTLSGGERQRVQLARVLLQVWQPILYDCPRWLFLDEPVSALDIGHQLLVMDIIRDFASAGGGVITVMHDLNLTAMGADQVLLMKNGEILTKGSPQHVLTDCPLSEAYNCRIKTGAHPAAGPWLLPQTARRIGC